MKTGKIKKMLTITAIAAALCGWTAFAALADPAGGPGVETPASWGPAEAGAGNVSNVIISPGVQIHPAEGPGAGPAGQQGNGASQSQIGQQVPIPQSGEQPADSNLVFSNGRQVDLTKPMLALTFDDGPQTTSGGRILDTFAKYGQRCTFFLVGDRIASRADEVRRMIAEGHEIGNHTYSHTYLNKTDAAGVQSQVARCNEAVAAATGQTPVVMRLPGGNKNSTVLANVNMPIILWNVDTQDWKYRNAEHVKNAVIGKVKDGDIVLMHELYSTTADAVETIVPTLVQQGFQLVTVSELARFRGVGLAPNTIYYSFRPQ